MDVHHWHNVKLHFPKPNKPIRYLNVTVSWKDLHMSSLHINNMYLFSVSTFLLDIAFGIEVSYRFFFFHLFFSIPGFWSNKNSI